MSVPGLRIREVAARAGLSAPTIRYYETIRLLPPPLRASSGYRHYTDATVEDLRFIRKAQALGFSLEDSESAARPKRSFYRRQRATGSGRT